MILVSDIIRIIIAPDMSDISARLLPVAQSLSIIGQRLASFTESWQKFRSWYAVTYSVFKVRWPCGLSLCCRLTAVRLASPLVTVSMVQPEHTIVNYSNVTVMLQTLQKYEQTVNSIIDIMNRVCVCVCVCAIARVCVCVWRVKHRAVTIRDRHLRLTVFSIMI